MEQRVVDARRAIRSASQAQRRAAESLAVIAKAQEDGDLPDRFGRFVLGPDEPVDVGELVAYMRQARQQYPNRRLVVTVVASR